MLEQLKIDVSLCVRARYPILYIVTWEETRAEKFLEEIARGLNKSIFFWSCSRGFEDPELRCSESHVPINALECVAKSSERAMFVFKDFHPFLDDRHVVRRLRDLVVALRTSYKTIIIVSPTLKIPLELEKDVTVFDLPVPTPEELMHLLKGFLAGIRHRPNVDVDLADDLAEHVVKAVQGLTEREAENVFAKALVRDSRFTEEDLPHIIDEKRQVIRKSGLLEYCDLTENLNNVGGLDALKKWLDTRRDAFSEKARRFGLPQPKGLLLLGVQGCGKSLTAKAIASLWKLPLVRLDVGAVFNPYIGTSEENMRKAIRTAEAMSPAVLWLDELEKAFSGVSGTGAVDAGVAERVFSTFLIWLQEKTKPVFVIATANRIEQLPPELVRKGRFDEIFFIDLPSRAERRDIFDIHLRRRGRHSRHFDLEKLARDSVGFTGAEIEAAIISAMYNAFPEDRDINTDDIISALEETIPLSKTAREQIEYIRNWAATRARPASGSFYSDEEDSHGPDQGGA